MAAPTIMTVLAVSGLDAWRLYRPNAPLFVTPIVDSLADAIAHDDVQRAYAFIRAGQDPNELIVARHPALTGGRPVEVPPLLWAVATQNRPAMLMLLGFGARMDATTERRAVCLAERLGRNDIARELELHAGHALPEPCPNPGVSNAALLEVLAEPE